MRRATIVASLSWAATAITYGAVGYVQPPQGSEFEQLLARHRQDISTPAGRAYEHSFTTHYQSTLGAVLGACIQQAGPPNTFEIIYVIDKDGRIIRAVPKVPTPLTACVIESVQRDRFPKPPFSPFREHVVQDFAP